MPIDDMKMLFYGAVSEMRRHFDVSSEGLRSEVRGVADAVAGLDERVERDIAAVCDELRAGFSETQAMIRFSC